MTMIPKLHPVTLALFVFLLNTLLSSGNAAELVNLPDPDGKPADMTKPVQVYILLGQSNMLGGGKVKPVDKDGSLLHAVNEKKLYPYLIDDAGEWTTRNDVRNLFVMGSGTGGVRRVTNDMLTSKGANIGPEHAPKPIPTIKPRLS